MLHAVNSHKAKLASLYREGQRLTLEDVITSSVFGPLEFMSDSDRCSVVAELARQLGLPVKVEMARLSFWHRRPAGLASEFRPRHIEPDLIIEIGEAGRLLIEVKWGAPLSSHELSSQWGSLSPDERKSSVHLLLARDLARYQDSIKAERAAVSAMGAGPWTFEQLSWRRLAEVFRALSGRHGLPAHVRAWAEQCARLLAREELRVMVGWSRLPMAPLPRLSWRVEGGRSRSCPSFKRLPAPPKLGWQVTPDEKAGR